MKNKGISLIVLIITIIVVIILAVTVILTLSKNNPIESAKEATFKQDVRSFQDELNMYISNDYTNKAGQRDNKITTSDFNEIKKYISSFDKKYKDKFVIKNDELVYNENKLTSNEIDWVTALNIRSSKIPIPIEWQTYISSMTDDGVPIPNGFTYLTGTKNTGTVIEDENHNEFVWIPVDGMNIKYEKFTTYNGSTPTGDDTLPSGVTDETADVTQYGGFYIGRYEATIPSAGLSSTNGTGVPTCKKDGIVWTKIFYTYSKVNAESMYTGTNSSVQSGLLTGKAWDTACHWIEGSVSSLTDSRTYGNFSNSQSPANVIGYGTKQLAGFSDKWCVKNIYDLAGNVWEWTSEDYSSSKAMARGCAFNSGGNCPVVERSDFKKEGTVYDEIGFRIRLYIKTT